MTTPTPITRPSRRFRSSRITPRLTLAAAGAMLSPMIASGQIDSARAHSYFAEASALCAKEGGRLWGVSLCGPMVFVDPRTRDIIANQPIPSAPRPAAMGYANAALPWGGTRWVMYVWPMLPADDVRARRTLLVHELMHRIQPQLGLFLNDGSADHLDAVQGRYLLQLEWRALAAALDTSGAARDDAIRDALAFRARRHAEFPGSAEIERVLEINEGLPQFTGTVVANATLEQAAAHAIEQLQAAPRNETLVRTFPYPSGAAYGVLLESYSPGWTRRVQPTDDIAQLLAVAANVAPADDVEAAARRYDGPDLLAAEQDRDVRRQARVLELRRRFVDAPVLVLPNGTQNAFTTNGMMPIPGEGTVYPTFRTTGEWGSLVAEPVLMSQDRSRLTVPAPKSTAGTTITGEGWTLEIAPGWVIRPGERAGDYRLVKDSGGDMHR